MLYCLLAKSLSYPSFNKELIQYFQQRIDSIKMHDTIHVCAVNDNSNAEKQWQMNKTKKQQCMQYCLDRKHALSSNFLINQLKTIALGALLK